MPHNDRSGHSFLEICIYSSSLRSVPSICDPCLSTDGRCSFVSLVALLTWRDLLFCAKHLFVAATGAGLASAAALTNAFWPVLSPPGVRRGPPLCCRGASARRGSSGRRREER